MSEANPEGHEMVEHEEEKPQKVDVDLNRYRAAILDMDGVVTSTARAHAASWKKMFDEYLQKWSRRQDQKFVPFDDKQDYYRYVDGKPRYEGVKSFLESRSIRLPYGSPDDPRDRETVCGLGNRKNGYFLQYLKKHGAQPYQTTVDFVQEMQKKSIKVGVISSSRNARAVLKAAGVHDLFQVIIDGKDIAECDLKGKPAPDVFLEAARKLGASPETTLVVEDAVSGVSAAESGGFALVIGIDRSGENRELKSHGADMLVKDLSQIRRKNNEQSPGT